jgi:hypothetical protein
MEHTGINTVFQVLMMALVKIVLWVDLPLTWIPLEPLEMMHANNVLQDGTPTKFVSLYAKFANLASITRTLEELYANYAQQENTKLWQHKLLPVCANRVQLAGMEMKKH